MNRKVMLGVAVLVFIGSLIYFAKHSEHELSLNLKPVTVRLKLSDEVKKGMERSHAQLAVQAILTDKEIAQSPLDASVINHRERMLPPGQSQVSFESTDLELEVPSADVLADPLLTVHVVSKLDLPAGNCIQCEEASRKLSALQGADNVIDVACEHWLALGVCGQAAQK